MSIKLFFKTLPLLLICNSTVASLTNQKPSDVKLISSHQVVAPDSQIDVGFHIKIKKNWHTYWKNPGDIGQPMKVTWHLPPSLKVSPLKWPRPQRISYKEWNHFGYKKNVLILSSVQIPKNNTLKTLPLKAEVTWLVCEHICIPMKKQVSLNLPVHSKEKLHPQNSEWIKQTQKKLPQPLNPETHLNALLEENKIILNFNKSFQFIDFFPIDSFPTEVPKVTKNSKTSYTLTFPDNEIKNQSFRSLIVYQQNQRILSSEVYIQAQQKILALILFMFFAFLGGLILNTMPCVLPVVFLKFYNTVRSKNLIFSSSLYSFGVVASFICLAFIITSFKEAGQYLGWGFQMQSPFFIVLMILFFTFIGLSFLDIIYIPPFLKVFQKNSYQWLHEILSGVLATVAATPCTAPFMGVAIGFAFSQSHLEILLIFACLGLGMASPYLTLSFFPQLIQKIPHPGKWNKNFKYLLSLPMFGTVIWLVYILVHMNPSWLFPILFALLGYGFSFWLLKEKLYPKKYSFTILFFSTVLVFYPYVSLKEPQIQKSETSKLQWKDFSELSDWKKQNKPILVNITAKWCLTCHFNDMTTFKNTKVIEYLKTNDIVILEGDWTSHDDEIFNFLQKYERAGIPFTIFFPIQGQEPVILPEILTPRLLIQKISTSSK